MVKVEFLILTDIWRIILKKINKANVTLQKGTMTLDGAINLFTSIVIFINIRNNFDEFESIDPEADYRDHYQKKKS